MKFVIEEWNTVTSNTIQVSEFNIGTNVSLDLGTGVENLEMPAQGKQAILYPNPAKTGMPCYLRLDDTYADAVISVYNLAGVRSALYRATGNTTEISFDKPGVYLIEISAKNQSTQLKIIVQ